MRSLEHLQPDSVVLEPVVKRDGYQRQTVRGGESGEVPAGGSAAHCPRHEDGQWEDVQYQSAGNDDRQAGEHDVLAGYEHRLVSVGRRAVDVLDGAHLHASVERKHQLCWRHSSLSDRFIRAARTNSDCSLTVMLPRPTQPCATHRLQSDWTWHSRLCHSSSNRLFPFVETSRPYFKSYT